MMSSRGMGAINPSKMPKAKVKKRRDNTDFTEFASGGNVSLAVGRGEKLPVSKGAGLTAKGRAKYNRETGSNLKAPQPQGGARQRSFCARMSGMPGPMKDEKGRPTRKAASLKRWNCK